MSNRALFILLIPVLIFGTACYEIIVPEPGPTTIEIIMPGQNDDAAGDDDDSAEDVLGDDDSAQDDPVGDDDDSADDNETLGDDDDSADEPAPEPVSDLSSFITFYNTGSYAADNIADASGWETSMGQWNWTIEGPAMRDAIGQQWRVCGYITAEPNEWPRVFSPGADQGIEIRDLFPVCTIGKDWSNVIDTAVGDSDGCYTFAFNEHIPLGPDGMETLHPMLRCNVSEDSLEPGEEVRVAFVVEDPSNVTALDDQMLPIPVTLLEDNIDPSGEFATHRGFYRESEATVTLDFSSTGGNLLPEFINQLLLTVTVTVEGGDVNFEMIPLVLDGLTNGIGSIELHAQSTSGFPLPFFPNSYEGWIEGWVNEEIMPGDTLTIDIYGSTLTGQPLTPGEIFTPEVILNGITAWNLPVWNPIDPSNFVVSSPPSGGQFTIVGTP